MDERTAQYLEHLKMMAPRMKRMVKPKNKAKIGYSIWAGGLYWSDEFPDFEDDLSDDLIRFLIRYRTSLILGRPQKNREIFWNEAQRLFPEWIGFDPARRAPNSELQRMYQEFSEKALAEAREGVD